MSHEALRVAAVEQNQRIERAGLVVLSFGNVSVADPSEGIFAIKPSGVGYADLLPDDIVLISIEDGRIVHGDKRPSSDTPTHLILYRAYSELGGIVHTHSPYATSWAQARRPIPCFGTTHADHFYGPVPVTRPLSDEEIGSEYEANTGRVIIGHFKGADLDPLHVPAVLVASHGPFAWGRSGAEAVDNAIALEAVAGMALHTLALAPDRGPVEDPLLDRHFLRKHGPSAYYGQPASEPDAGVARQWARDR
jgi:L-ribulose-5-phosphate 4-epimerase